MTPATFENAATDILQKIKNTPAQSDERRQLMLQANEDGLLDTSRFGANVSVTLIPDVINSPLDDIKVAHVLRRHPQGHPQAGEDDGTGPFGGRGDAGETPIVTALREMMEEMLDAGMIEVLPPMTAEDYIQKSIRLFIEENPEAELDNEDFTPSDVKNSLQTLQNKSAVFHLDDVKAIDIKRLSFVPMDEAVDLSFPMSLEKGSDIFDGMQVTKPYQFVYQTADEIEFDAYLTNDDNEIDDLGEARSVEAFTLREIIQANKSGLPDYNAETDIRYTHEGFVASFIALQNGADHSEVYALHPAPKEMAEMMGISDATFKDWHRRALTLNEATQEQKPQEIEIE